ncbi:SRPBCC family protein [Pseudomonas sp. 5Ae-yellow]|uniref:SRPBCC family protein n=1 Tax=Pseudomonas sp. 5Ae-yellow TaxID=2759848 RepID=UPI0015F76003|nr:SRPBCC family protein [Pseudomonas sp. 5Ae-yellow]MBA6420989.1 SRPBCC family protein [Pseudomonas sp. 5Ae-yellow]
MNIKYKFALPVTPEKAWSVLTDIPSVAPCMPGASLESSEGDEHTGRMKVKLGPIDMTFRGSIVFKERDDERRHAVLEAAASEVKGGGSTKATVIFFVSPAINGSEISVESDFTVSGKAAQFGGGVIDSVGKKLMDQFAKRLAAHIEASQSVPEVAVASTGEHSVQSPADALAQPRNPMVEEESLNLLSVAWKPVALRAAISVSALAIVGYGVYWTFA